MKLFLSMNLYNSDQITQAETCVKALINQGYECSLSTEASVILSLKDQAKYGPEDCDVIVSLGGDGAVLRAGQIAVSVNKPLIGINSGRLGYLCAMSFNEIGSFRKIFEKCVLRKHPLLEFVFNDTSYVAINDVILAKKNFGSSIDVSISISGYKKYNVRGDGVVISTPVGSSAYNFSAGGPMVDPSSGCVVLTPVCSHSGLSSSVVLSNERSIAMTERDDAAVIYADGSEIGNVNGEITVEKAEESLMIYTREDCMSVLI